MPKKSWWIIGSVDARRETQASFRAGPQDLQTSGSWSVTAQKHEVGLPAGVVTIAIDNGKLRLDVVPTRGMGIHAVHIAGDYELPRIGWKSPIRGPVHPSFVDLGEPSGLGWLDGFDEFFVRCGLESNGAPDFDSKTGRLIYPLHGRIANRPAHDVALTIDTDKQEMVLRGIVEETRFHFLKLRMTSTITTKFGSSSFTVR